MQIRHETTLSYFPTLHVLSAVLMLFSFHLFAPSPFPLRLYLTEVGGFSRIDSHCERQVDFVFFSFYRDFYREFYSAGVHCRSRIHGHSFMSDRL